MDEGLYFDASKLPRPRGRYILWCDGMGTARAFARSLASAANYVCKLQLAFARATHGRSGVYLYPMMDGCYLVANSRKLLCEVARAAMTDLAHEFVKSKGADRKFMARGAIAYGATIVGDEIPENALHPNAIAELGASATVAMKRLILSPALVLAYEGEKKAPPFGFYVDDSAMAIPQLVSAADTGFTASLWQWWAKKAPDIEAARALFEQIASYLDECEKRPVGKGYSSDRILAHRALSREYFEVWD